MGSPYFAWTAVLTFAAPVFAQHEAPVQPVVQEFAEMQYRQETVCAGQSRRYFLSDVLLLPSREWIAFVVEGNHNDSEWTEPVAVGIYHVASGRKRQFAFPLHRDLAQRWVAAELISLDAHRCGIVVAFSPLFGDERAERPAQEGNVRTSERRPSRNAADWHYFLWEWNLTSDEVRFRGALNQVVSYIAPYIKLGECEVSWRRTSADKLDGDLSLRDRSSGGTAAARLRLGQGSLYSDGVTCAPTSRPCAFAVCDALDVGKGAVEVRCIDANAPGGIRWRIGKGNLEAAVGAGVVGAAFLPNVESSTLPLPLFVHRIVDEKCFSHLLFLDQKTGDIAIRKYRLPLDTLYPELPVMSRDNKHLAIGACETVEVNEDGGLVRYCCKVQVRVVDLDSGESRKMEDLSDTLVTPSLRGFLDDDRLVLFDEGEIVLFDMRGKPHLKRLVQMFGSSDVEESKVSESESGRNTPIRKPCPQE